ncbi:hypothetical protein CYMTET_40559 [Cymbomonas tetramitiformis]|uniref:Uncharacterized protein n=1 Tax=Cymbomonas tetramitiformis TaxID=36881 RepID=A0AAE0F3F3_9CHLO|nr:hypothetical protein CYMTET_40559 [Cymbomonas tetramitiformis]
MAGVTTRGARRALMKDSDVDSVVRLKSDVLNPPTPATPAVAEPTAVKADDTADMIATRKLYQEQAALVRQADGNDNDYDAKLGKFVEVYTKTQFENAALDVSPFDFDDLTKEAGGTAERGKAAGSVLSAAVLAVDDTKSVLKLVLEKIKVLEHYIRTQKGGVAAVYQEAAGAGGDALAAMVEMHGALAVLRGGGDADAFDVSAYGFATGGAEEEPAGGLYFQHFKVDKEDVEVAPASGGAPSFHAMSDSNAPASASGGELAAGDGDEDHAGMETDQEEDSTVLFGTRTRWLRDAAVAARASARHLADIGSGLVFLHSRACCGGVLRSTAGW